MVHATRCPHPAAAIERRRGAEAFGIETSDVTGHVLIAGYAPLAGPRSPAGDD